MFPSLNSSIPFSTQMIWSYFVWFILHDFSLYYFILALYLTFNFFLMLQTYGTFYWVQLISIINSFAKSKVMTKLLNLKNMHIHPFIVYKVILASMSNYLGKMCFQSRKFVLIWLISLMYCLFKLSCNILIILD